MINSHLDGSQTNDVVFQSDDRLRSKTGGGFWVVPPTPTPFSNLLFISLESLQCSNLSCFCEMLQESPQLERLGLKQVEFANIDSMPSIPHPIQLQNLYYLVLKELSSPLIDAFFRHLSIPTRAAVTVHYDAKFDFNTPLKSRIYRDYDGPTLIFLMQLGIFIDLDDESKVTLRNNTQLLFQLQNLTFKFGSLTSLEVVAAARWFSRCMIDLRRAPIKLKISRSPNLRRAIRIITKGPFKIDHLQVDRATFTALSLSSLQFPYLQVVWLDCRRERPLSMLSLRRELWKFVVEHSKARKGSTSIEEVNGRHRLEWTS